ncbi:MAG TPA: type II secretion system protein GspN [Candidatus Eisenbacteria bacterium]|nr:type II secretion system protein GspN [Candidatus Eisenbacteria bacterium]
MTRRRLAIAGLVVVAFLAGVAITFPTEAVVRAMVARVPLPDQMQVSFASAHLRPDGLRLDDVHLTRPDGSNAFDADWLRLRPSLLGLWRDRTGRPWSVALATCQGRIEIEVGAEGATTPISVVLTDVELATCIPYVAPRVDAYGRVNGAVHARVGGRDPTSGDGAFEIRGAAWHPGGGLEDLVIRADAATLRGRLADRRFELETIEASSEDFRATGRGSIRFVTPTNDSVLDLRLSVTPGHTMPPTLRRWFDGVPGAAPDAQGTRTLRLQGTIGNPRLVAAGRLE